MLAGGSLGTPLAVDIGAPEAASEILFMGDMGDEDETESKDELGVCELGVREFG